MVRLLVLLMVIATSTSCRHALFAQANNVEQTPVGETNMSSATDLFIRRVTLRAREEKRPPLGVPPQLNRDIGFASVFLKIENLTEANATLRVDKIEIRNASNSHLQAFSYSPQDIHLKPLEHSEIVFHLTNKTGYSGQDNVKAVVTYQTAGQVSVVESEPVEVKRL
jgi:hypothetical protein